MLHKVIMTIAKYTPCLHKKYWNNHYSWHISSRIILGTSHIMVILYLEWATPDVYCIVCWTLENYNIYVDVCSDSMTTFWMRIAIMTSYNYGYHWKTCLHIVNKSMKKGIILLATSIIFLNFTSNRWIGARLTPKLECKILVIESANISLWLWNIPVENSSKSYSCKVYRNITIFQYY